jgi:hypothetical protein
MSGRSLTPKADQPSVSSSRPQQKTAGLLDIPGVADRAPNLSTPRAGPRWAPHHGASIIPPTSKMISSSTGGPSGGLAAPTTNRQGLFSEDVLQQLRSGVGDFRLVAHISRSGHQYTEADHPRHFVERSQVLPRDSENVECREASRLSRRFHIELSANTPNEFRPVAFRRQHPARKKQSTRLHRFHIRTERLRRCRDVDAEFFQTLLGAGRPLHTGFEHFMTRSLCDI